MPTYHSTKEDLAEHLWLALKRAGADQGLISQVSGQTLHLVPDDDDVCPGAFNRLIDAVVQCAWKRGVADCLVAIEIGAITPIRPATGKN